MDFVNQIKKLKDLTKSPKVRELCESYLNGGMKMDPESFFNNINEEDSNFSDNIKEHVDAIKNEQNEISRRSAQSLMESWGGIKNTSLGNSGTFITNNPSNSLNESLIDQLDDLSLVDGSARSFRELQKLNNLGILESLAFLKTKAVYSYPQTKIVCEQFRSVVEDKGVKEFLLAESYVNELSKIGWDSDVKDVIETISEKIKKYSIFRPDILFSQKKYNSIFIVKNGGWHFTNLKDPKKIHDKFSNYLHHREFEYSNIKIKDIKSMIKNKISIYNHEVDKSQNKFDGTVKLYKLSNKYLPKYLVKNISKYKAWFN